MYTIFLLPGEDYILKVQRRLEKGLRGVGGGVGGRLLTGSPTSISIRARTRDLTAVGDQQAREQQRSPEACAHSRPRDRVLALSPSARRSHPPQADFLQQNTRR